MDQGRGGDTAQRRAAALVPFLAAAAPRIEQTRELPPDVLSALHEARLFRLLLPRALGGEELSPTGFVEVTETLAAGDASVAWCVGQGGGCAMAAAALDPEAAAEIFGAPDAVLAWGAGASGRAVPVPGGVRVSGRWLFASGSRHAGWLGGHCILDGGGERTALFPRDRAQVTDSWYVIGLKGTGSDSYAVEDLFVPARHVFARDCPTAAAPAAPVYRFATTQLFAAGFAGVALGLARATIDALLRLAAGKTPRGARPMREDPVLHARLGQAEAELRAARVFLFQTLAGVEGAAATGGLAVSDRVSLRLAATHAIQRARAVMETGYELAGADAIFEGGAFERRLRDMHALSQQVQGRATHFETVGRHLLGLEPDRMFL